MSPPPTQESAVLLLVQTIQTDVHEMKDTLKKHIETEPAEWAAQLRDLMNDAFPAGDPSGHRRFHEAQIKSAEDKAAFWAEMRKSITKWGIFGFTLWAIKTLVEAGALWIQHGGHIK